MKRGALVTGAAFILPLVTALWCGPETAGAAFRSWGTQTVSGESGNEPDPENGEEMQKELQELIDELKGLEQDVREKIQKDVIPRIRDEIRNLREKLRELDPHEEPSDTRKI